MPTSVLNLFAGADSSLSTEDVVLRLALIGCSIFAVVQLLSMWGTRYGDNNTLGKSLFLSLMLHGCLGLGWATVAQNLPQEASGTPIPELKEMQVDFIQNVDSSPMAGTNDMQVFVKGSATDGAPTREGVNFARQHNEQTMPEVESPPLNQNPVVDDIRDIPDFATLPQESAPDLDVPEMDTARAPISGPSLQDQPIVTESKPRSVTRANVSRTGQNSLPADAFDAPSSPAVRRGASTRLSPTIQDGSALSLPTEQAAEAPPKPFGSADNDSLRRPESPNPAPFDDGEAGSMAESNSDSKSPVISNPRRTSRSLPLETRANQSRDDMEINGGLARPSIRSGKSRQSTTTTSVTDDDRQLPTNPRADINDSSEPTLDSPNSRSGSRTPARAPETYRARTLGQRMSSARKNGGSEESEKAVEDSLKWLASIQESDGHWSAATYGGGAEETDREGQPRHGGGKFADSGITGLVILSFLGAGYTHEKGPYIVEVRKALDWLINQQMDNGYLGGESKYYDQNYCHAMATFALAEAYAMQADEAEYPELRGAVKAGVALIVSMQNADGGWRYQKGVASDMSMFGWQVMALKSAVNGGISVPEKTRLGMVRFLNSHGQGAYGGLAGYKKGDRPTPAMTAEALFCRQLFSVRANDPACKEATAFLRKRLPSIRDAESYDEYYWYYGTLAMRNQDTESWREWNSALRDLLISMQRKQGQFAGSWDPKGKWAGIGGRLYSTALSTMCLEVYYRYQTNNKSSDSQ